MDDAALEAFVTELQHRRMHARREYEAAQQLRNEKMTERMREQLDHTMKQLGIDFDLLDKRLSKVTERLVKIRAMRAHISLYQREEAANIQDIQEAV
jgi:hypothetical protein